MNKNKEKKDNKQSVIDRELCISNVWKIVGKISHFSKWKLRRVYAVDRCHALGFDDCLEMFANALEKLEKEYVKRKQ